MGRICVLSGEFSFSTKVTKSSTEISWKLVTFVAFSGNPLKLYNAIDEEWREERKRRERKKRSKLTA
jgi:hypothetical protein